MSLSETSISSPANQPEFWLPRVCVGTEPINQSVKDSPDLSLLSVKSVQSTPVQPLHHQGRDQRAVKVCQGQSVDLHKAGMGYDTITKKLGENVTTVGAIIPK